MAASGKKVKRSGDDHRKEETMDFIGSIINEFKSLPLFWWLWLIAAFVGV